MAHWPGVCVDNLLIMNRRPQGSLSSQSLGKYWQLDQNNQETEHIQMQTNNTQKGPNKQQTHWEKTYTKRQDRDSLV